MTNELESRFEELWNMRLKKLRDKDRDGAYREFCKLAKRYPPAQIIEAYKLLIADFWRQYKEEQYAPNMARALGEDIKPYLNSAKPRSIELGTFDLRAGLVLANRTSKYPNIFLGFCYWKDPEDDEDEPSWQWRPLTHSEMILYERAGMISHRAWRPIHGFYMNEERTEREELCQWVTVFKG